MIIPRCAIDGGHEEVVRCLVSCGAHLSLPHEELGEILCAAARQGFNKRLNCYKLAGK